MTNSLCFSKGIIQTKSWRIVGFLLLLSSSTPVVQAYIIADHNFVTEFDVGIPQFYIDQVKTMLLNYPGESHGRGLLSGLRLLEEQDSRFAVSIGMEGAPEDDTDQHFRVHRPEWRGSSWNKWGTGEEDTWTNQAAIDRLNNHFAYARDVLNNPFDAFAFGWCWDMTSGNPPGGGIDPVYNVRWAGMSVGGPDGNMRWGLDADDTVLTGNSVSLQNYLDAWIYYQQNNPDMTVIYSTGPVDIGGESGYQRYLKHERIREWVRNGTDRVLFDYAEILTYNNAGEQNTATWDAHTYPLEHPENDGEDDPFGYGSGHLSNEGYLKIGKAMWVLMAKLAGWDGCAAVRGDVTGDCIVDSFDLAAMASAWLAEPNSPGWDVHCDIASDGGDGIIDSQDFAVFTAQWQEGVQTIRAAVSLDNQWMYQNLSGSTDSNVTVSEEITYDPLYNVSYTYSWEFVLPADVNVPPSTIDGGGSGDTLWTFAAPCCDEVEGLSDSGLVFKVKVTITGLQYGNTGTAEADFGIALLGDVNNDGVVNVADRGIINAFWRTGAAGSVTLKDCDLNCDGTVNVVDRSIANAIWRGSLGQNFVSSPCPLR